MVQINVNPTSTGLFIISRTSYVSFNFGWKKRIQKEDPLSRFFHVSFYISKVLLVEIAIHVFLRSPSSDFSTCRSSIVPVFCTWIDDRFSTGNSITGGIMEI